MTCETAKCKLIHCKFDKLYHICLKKDSNRWEPKSFWAQSVG